MCGRARAVSCALLALLLLPGPAAAETTVSSVDRSMAVTGDAGGNAVTIAFELVAGDQFARVTATDGLVPGPGCVPEGLTVALCDHPWDAVTARLGDGDDAFASDLWTPTHDVTGGPGADTLEGGTGVVDAGAGDDDVTLDDDGDQRIIGGTGADVVRLTPSRNERFVHVGPAPDRRFGDLVEGDVETVHGSEWDDNFFVGTTPGPGHALIGGEGYDSVSYEYAYEPVTVTLDGRANDGWGDRHDDIQTEMVIGSIFGDALLGGAGDDDLWGAGGRDTLDGGAGDDILRGLEGPDELRGGPGVDVASYDRDFGPVTVRLDGEANDGEAGEGDNVLSDNEAVIGAFSGSVLIGDGGDNTLVGDGGKDRIAGLGGDDALLGGFGDDVLDGGSGEDLFADGGGYASRGDQFEMRDGERDEAVCGTVNPIEVLADQHDEVSADCRAVRRSQVDPSSGATGSPTGGGADGAGSSAGSSSSLSLARDAAGLPASGAGRQLLLSTRSLRARRGIVRLRVACPAGTACRGTLVLRARRAGRSVRIGRTAFALPAGRAGSVRVRLSRPGRRLLRPHRALRVTAVVAGAAGAERPLATISLRR